MAPILRTAPAMRWRYVADDDVSASFWLAADEAIARRRGTGQSPPTLTDDAVVAGLGS